MKLNFKINKKNNLLTIYEYENEALKKDLKTINVDLNKEIFINDDKIEYIENNQLIYNFKNPNDANKLRKYLMCDCKKLFIKFGIGLLILLSIIFGFSQIYKPNNEMDIKDNKIIHLADENKEDKKVNPTSNSFGVADDDVYKEQIEKQFKESNLNNKENNSDLNAKLDALKNNQTNAHDINLQINNNQNQNSSFLNQLEQIKQQ